MASADERTEAEGLLRFVDASPSPGHAALAAGELLRGAGFELLELTRPWSSPGRHYVIRGGTLLAWSVPAGWQPERGLRLLAAHTDSPNLRLRPRPEASSQGFLQLGVEVYGGALLNSWLDRDLGLSGIVALDGPEGVEERLLRIDRPLLRVPQLASHLSPELKTGGLALNPQTQMVPVWGLGPAGGPGLRELLAAELSVEPGRVLAWELMAHDLTPSTLSGRGREFISAPRLDDLGCSYVCTRAMVDLAGRAQGDEAISVLILVDQEEVGSETSRGAYSELLGGVIERVLLAHGLGRADYLRTLAASACLSADMGHAAHPNYPERSDPGHPVRLNGGPVIKSHAGQHYATGAPGAARFARAADRAGVPVQWLSPRGDLRCGSTIGPILAQQLGVETVDVGMAQLAMHSAREMGGSADPGLLLRALGEWLAS